MLNANRKPECLSKFIVVSIFSLIIGAGLSYKFIDPSSGVLSDGDGARFYKSSPVVANVNGVPVYQLEADNIVKAVIPGGEKQVSYKDLDEKSKAMIIREVAAQRAMIKEAKAKDVKDNDMARKVYEFKNKLTIDQFLAKFVNTEITQDKLLEKYNDIEKNVKGKQQIKVSHILLGSEDEANNVIEHLKKESFAKIAKEVSLDSSTKDKGGDLGYLLAGTMDPDFEKAALALKPGEISGPVKTKFGWHVIKLEEKKLATIAPFDTLKQRIAQDIYNEALKKYADTLLEGVKIDLVASAEPVKKEETKADDKTAPAKKDTKKDDSQKSDK